MPMNATRFTADSPLGEIAATLPSAIALFRQHHLDYCCGGARSLGDAARERGLDPDRLLEELQSLVRSPSDRDWTTAPTGEFIDHILATHHDYLKRVMPELRRTAAKVAQVHGENHPEVVSLLREIDPLFAELDAHLMKEEQILFPMLRGLAGEPGGAAPAHCGPEGPMHVMEMEHESAGAALKRMRELTHDYALPEDACTSYRGLYAGLQELEADLHVHIHLENNILFPRMRALLQGV